MRWRRRFGLCIAVFVQEFRVLRFRRWCLEVRRESVARDLIARQLWQRFIETIRGRRRCFACLFVLSPSRHEAFVTGHTEYALRGSSIAKIVDFPLAIATSETVGTERLISCQYSQILDLVVACAAAVGAIVADERSVAEQKEIGIRIKESAAGIAAETVYMPSISSCA